MPCSLTKNIIALQHGMIVIPAPSLPALGCHTDAKRQLSLVYTIQAELMNLGYMLSPEALPLLEHQQENWLVKYHDEVISYLRHILGDGNYQPLYFGFPQQVIEQSDIKLFANAIRHYDSKGTWVPNAYTCSRPTAFEHVSYKMIVPASDAEFGDIFTQILSANQSITPADKQALEWAFAQRDLPKERRGIDGLLIPKEIPFKETLCIYLANGELPPKDITVTDILRMVIYMCGGDVSLPAGQRVRIKLTRKQRKIVMRYLDVICRRAFTQYKGHDVTELAPLHQDMKRHKELWKRVCEVLHPSNYMDSEGYILLKTFYDDHIIRTWNSKVENAKTEEERLELLSQRPGEFARRLDSMLRHSNNHKAIIDKFSQCADHISIKVLFELYSHFENRREVQDARFIYIKGKRRPVKLPALPLMPGELIDVVQNIIVDAIKRKLSHLGFIGKVWLDERLKYIPLPTNMRSVSESTRPLPRGMRLPIENKSVKTLRFYVHWMDEEGREDLDLSATLITEKTSFIMSFDKYMVLTSDKVFLNQSNTLYGRMRCGEMITMGDDAIAFIPNDKQCEVIAVHSGDVRCRKGACAEYIDINIDSARRNGIKYVLVDVRNYKSRSLASVSPSFGYMEREYPEVNNQWAPATVADSFRITTEATSCIMLLFDVERMEYIPLDIDSRSITATGDSQALEDALKMYVNPPKLSVYNLLKWHVEARGGLILDSEQKLACENAGEGFSEFRFEYFSDSYMQILKCMVDAPPK